MDSNSPKSISPLRVLQHMGDWGGEGVQMKLNIRVRIVFCPCGQEHGVNIALYKCIPR